MIPRGYWPARLSLGWDGRRLPKPFDRLFRTCENAACKQRSLLRSLRLRDVDGIRLHGQWYCSAECFERAAQDEFARLLTLPGFFERLMQVFQQPATQRGGASARVKFLAEDRLYAFIEPRNTDAPRGLLDIQVGLAAVLET